MCICIYIYTIYIYFIYYKCPCLWSMFPANKRSFFWNCFIALLLRLAAQQCTKPHTSIYDGHEFHSFALGYVPTSLIKGTFLRVKGDTPGVLWGELSHPNRSYWGNMPLPCCMGQYLEPWHQILDRAARQQGLGSLLFLGHQPMLQGTIVM